LAQLFEMNPIEGGQKTALRRSKNRIIVYAGQYYDSETGLHYNYHRYYDPKLGRYLRPDPSHSNQPQGSSFGYLIPNLLMRPQEFNTYSYAGNSPIMYFDPTGLECCKNDNEWTCQYVSCFCLFDTCACTMQQTCKDKTRYRFIDMVYWPVNNKDFLMFTSMTCGLWEQIINGPIT
jgi:RHS repeat-associated protein